MRRTVTVLSIALSAVLAVAASSSRWEHVPAKDHARSNPMATNSAAAAGALVYRDHCLQCHKADAEGDGHKRPSLRSERIRSANDGISNGFSARATWAMGCLRGPVFPRRSAGRLWPI